MTIPAATETLPLEMDPEGVIRVSKTRVTLETLVQAFAEGATPEEIAQQYPAVPLADIYSVIGYYLKQREEIEGYLAQRQAQAEQTRQENGRRGDQSGIRARLTARRQNQGD